MKKEGNPYGMVEILIGVVILGGLGTIAMLVNNLHGRVCALEARLPADFEQRFSTLEINIAVIKALTTRVDNLSERVAALGPAPPQIYTPSKAYTPPRIYTPPPPPQQPEKDE